MVDVRRRDLRRRSDFRRVPTGTRSPARSPRPGASRKVPMPLLVPVPITISLGAAGVLWPPCRNRPSGSTAPQVREFCRSAHSLAGPVRPSLVRRTGMGSCPPPTSALTPAPPGFSPGWRSNARLTPRPGRANLSVSPFRRATTAYVAGGPFGAAWSADPLAMHPVRLPPQTPGRIRPVESNGNPSPGHIRPARTGPLLARHHPQRRPRQADHRPPGLCQSHPQAHPRRLLVPQAPLHRQLARRPGAPRRATR